MKTRLTILLILFLTVSCIKPLFAADWWNMPDADFAQQYGKLAVGSQQDQSKFAWMLFARANQPTTCGGGTFSQWECWPSDSDTFAPNVMRFTVEKKIRTQPHLQQSKLRVLLKTAHDLKSFINPVPPGGGEEVTRNQLSYGYIMDNGLNTQAGMAKFFSGANAKVDFPIGTVETKAFWVRGAIAGAYQVTNSANNSTFSLTGLHLMVKVAPQPSNPFTDNTPSWFWTTFEFKNNKGWAAAEKLITYPNTLPSADVTKILSESSVPAAFANYLSDGEQIQFSDAKNKKIVLGNTQIEWFLATPQNQDPTTWKSWSSSCHSCHGQASGQPSGGGIDFFQFTGPVGPLTGADLPPSGYKPLDFVWAFLNAQ